MFSEAVSTREFLNGLCDTWELLSYNTKRLVVLKFPALSEAVRWIEYNPTADRLSCFCNDNTHVDYYYFNVDYKHQHSFNLFAIIRALFFLIKCFKIKIILTYINTCFLICYKCITFLLILLYFKRADLGFF